jgi:ABC-type branched-subunit amino acid transport system permease subunit
VLTALPEALRGAKEYMEVIYAAILLLSLLFMPKGLIAGWEFSRDLVARRIRSRWGTGRAAPVD